MIWKKKCGMLHTEATEVIPPKISQTFIAVHTMGVIGDNGESMEDRLETLNHIIFNDVGF